MTDRSSGEGWEDAQTFIAEYTADLRHIARDETVITNVGTTRIGRGKSLRLGMSGPDEDDWKYEVTIELYAEDGEVEVGGVERTLEGRPMSDFPE